MRNLYEELTDYELMLEDISLELEFPLHMLGNKLRYELSTKKRELKHKINKLKESLYEGSSNY